MRGRWIAMLAVAAMALAGCGGDGESAGSDTTQEATRSAVEADDATTGTGGDAAAADAADDAGAARGAVTVTSADSELGVILVDGEGMTLYVFDNDTDQTSTCTGDCAANWPPLTGEATAGGGADDSLLGSSQRDDGTPQVTYAGRPLYHFAGDQGPGDTNGQAVGDRWWVIGPDGEAVTTSATQADDRGGY